MIYQAGNQITLNAGFCVSADSDFTALIGACDNTSPLGSSAEMFINANKASANASSLKAISEKQILSLTSYPNPFAGEISIQFNLEENSPVTIGIYHTNGQLLEQLLFDENRSIGLNTISYKASKLEAGIFYVVAQIGTSVHVQKVVKIK